MNKDLKSFVKEVKTKFGKESSTLMGIKNFHRRFKAAFLIAKDVFGDDVELDPKTVLMLYEYLVKEEVAALWLAKVKADYEIKNKSKSKKKESVIEDVSGDSLFSYPDKMSN